MLIFILCFLRIQTASATDSVYNKNGVRSLTDNNTNRSKAIEDTCFNFDPQSCSGVCGQFFELWCSCDEYCQVYGRCCFDYDTVCKEESEMYRVKHENLMNVSTECDTNISGYFRPQQIITSCSQTNISIKIVELCEAETRSTTIVSKVMSRRTELHYKNRYCMLCNGEIPDDVVYWPTMVGTTYRRVRVNNIQDIMNLFQNPIRIIPPPNSTEIICVPQIISSCVTFSSSEELRLCKENPLSPITHRSKIYKNTFCLQCSVHLALQKNYDVCHLSIDEDIFYGKYEQSFVFSFVLNWKINREASVLIQSKFSFIENLSCSLDTQDNLHDCKIQKCVGTLPVVNDTCQVGDNHFGCLRYIFKINFTIPMDSSSEKALEHISSKLVLITTNLERVHNVTKYYNQTINLHDIIIFNNHISGFVILSRLAYHLCFLKFSGLFSGLYFEYLDNNLFINMNGSISTCRYIVRCYSWCYDWTQLNCTQYQRYFTANTTDMASFATILAPICIYIMFLIHIYGIVVADWASIPLQNLI